MSYKVEWSQLTNCRNHKANGHSKSHCDGAPAAQPLVDKRDSKDPWNIKGKDRESIYNPSIDRERIDWPFDGNHANWIKRTPRPLAKEGASGCGKQ
ncbi:hypothetical protein [Novosphingobium sp.]|uniref:hypothetical protein n=1 Tax=Novosphingobium sp. TaxID=1874826 RepID=UPI001DF90D4F|nr:hypothetical protein [Novosphingobium sp.]MBX9662531.1 hypothetical protein [Novosphingobium sp.]